MKKKNEEEKEIIKALQREGIPPEEAKAIKETIDDIDNIFTGEPGERMDQRFYSMLENESSRQQRQEHRTSSAFKNNRAWMLAAAGIALFILGWFSASWFEASSYSRKTITGLSDEVRDLRETLALTMLSQDPASERIKAVNMIKELDQPTDNMIRNLFRVLDSDENDNVRLLALEALLKYSGSDEVREQLVASIPKQTSPLIQLRMVEIMTALTEKRAVPEFRRLLDEPGLNYSVRKSMEDALGTLL